MEIKDVMLQALRAITVLQISYETVLDRRNEYDKEHPEERGEDGWILHKNPPFGLNGIETIIEENYNMIIEWLIEGLEERDLSDLVKVKSFFAFWQKYQRCYKYQYSDKDDFIDEVPGRILEKLEFKIKYDDDIQTRVKLYDEKYRIPMTDEEIKEKASEDM